MCLCESHLRGALRLRSYSIVPGETTPRSCPDCDFGHGTEDKFTLKYKTLLEEEERLSSDKSKAGKARFSRWRMAHALKHRNIQPGEYGRPFFDLDLDDFILDLLHLAELGVPKTPWKHGILNNASDDARQQIEDLLAEWRHKLGCRRKDANRVSAQKWFTGEAWSSFCAGLRGSPGGPVAIAKIVKIIADDMQRRGVDRGSYTAEELKAASSAAAPATPAAPAKSGKAALATKKAAAKQTAPAIATLVEEADKELDAEVMAKRASHDRKPT